MTERLSEHCRMRGSCDKPATEVAGDPAVFRAFQSSLAGLVRTSQVKLAEYSAEHLHRPPALYYRSPR